MIPPDVANSLRAILPDQQTSVTTRQTQPVAPPQRIADVLSNLVPGQRIFAEIQSLLPNGNYRALVSQRDITLALPFSAKPGDSLELEVTESDGKLTLAFVANKSDAAATKSQEAVATSLSQTGKLIGDLMKGIEGEGKRAPPAPLNGNQAVVSNMPKTGAELAPILKQALSQSGMFYEAHQARWVAGELPTDALRQEPQGKLPANAAVNVPSDLKMTTATGQAGQPTASLPNVAATHGTAVEQGIQGTQSAQPVPREITPLVQQQLDGLANQNFAWQGQIWPGQQMWWEIGQDQTANATTDEQASRWKTRLKLQLPMLGEVEATLQLHPGGGIGINVTTGSASSETLLRESTDSLRTQMEAAGLNLTQLLVQHGQPEN